MVRLAPQRIEEFMNRAPAKKDRDPMTFVFDFGQDILKMYTRISKMNFVGQTIRKL